MTYLLLLYCILGISVIPIAMALAVYDEREFQKFRKERDEDNAFFERRRKALREERLNG
jgi:hypothetical protein